MAPEIPYDEPNGKKREEKIFIGFMAVCFTIGGLLVAVLAVTLFIAMWQAGLVNFIVWTSIIAFIAWVSKLVYRRLLKSDWL